MSEGNKFNVSAFTIEKSIPKMMHISKHDNVIYHVTDFNKFYRIDLSWNCIFSYIRYKKYFAKI